MSPLKSNLSRRCFNTGVLAGTLTSTSTTLHASNLDVANESDSLSLLDVPQSLEAHVATLFGTQPIVRSGIRLTLPALAENGNRGTEHRDRSAKEPTAHSEIVFVC